MDYNTLKYLKEAYKPMKIPDTQLSQLKIVADSLNRNKELMKYIASATSIARVSADVSPVIKMLADSQAVSSAFNNPAIKEMFAAQEAMRKTFSCLSISQIASSQQTIISKLQNFEKYDLSEIMETVKSEDLEEQFEVIREEKDSKVKEYLITNHLLILSIIVPVIMFLWTVHSANETSKQNERIISLLEKQNQIKTEQLEEETGQAELIELQTELLKELILYITEQQKSSINSSKANQND